MDVNIMNKFLKDNKIHMMADHVRQSCKTFKKREDYFVRIKCNKKDEFADYLEDISDAYQVALEGDNETNYHIQCVIKFHEKNRENIKIGIKKWYINNVHKPKINTYYSCTVIRENAIRVLAYNFKEDRIPLMKNVNKEDIKLAKMLSHGKDLRQLAKRLEKIKEDYFKSSVYPIHKLVTNILILKADFNQCIYMNRIEAEVRYIMIKKNKYNACRFAHQICDKIEYGDNTNNEQYDLQNYKNLND